MQGQLGLREVVVCLHAVGVQVEGFQRVGEHGVPGGEFQAGHGSVGEEFGVRGVFEDAVCCVSTECEDGERGGRGYAWV